MAREANQPATAAAYYFKSIDDLLTAALTVCMDQDAERMRLLAEKADGSPEGLTALADLLRDVVSGPGRLLAEYELYLLAARLLELRTSTGHWLDAIAGYAHRYTTDPVRVQVFKGVIDGLLLQGLLTDTPPTAAEFEAVLRHVLL